MYRPTPDFGPEDKIEAIVHVADVDPNPPTEGAVEPDMWEGFPTNSVKWFYQLLWRGGAISTTYDENGEISFYFNAFCKDIYEKGLFQQYLDALIEDADNDEIPNSAKELMNRIPQRLIDSTFPMRWHSDEGELPGNRDVTDWSGRFRYESDNE